MQQTNFKEPQVPKDAASHDKLERTHRAKEKEKLIKLGRSKYRKSLFVDEQLVERFLQQIQFTALYILPKVLMQRVAKGSTPKKNPL